MHCLGITAFTNLNNISIYKCYNKAAEESMLNVAENIHKTTTDDLTKTRVKIDGAWSRRGHVSLNGVVTATIGDKCIGTQALSKFCKGCKMWENNKGTPEYERWEAEHVCHINHTKSSGAMESAGAVELFGRSVSKYNLIYNEYLGDGDTSSYKAVVDSSPYEDIDIVKLECVGHVQKRLGTRLRNKVKKHKGTATPLGGRGKLTENIINSMQNFYAVAIRNNSNNLYVMKKAVGAILWHCTDLPDETRHRFCTTDKGTWCKWQLDKINGTKRYNKSNITIPKSIHDIIKPIFEELSSDALLEKCLHGETQNSNESLNAVIWTRCPKNVFVSRRTFKIGINSAILQFNEGEKVILKVYDQFGLRGSAMDRNIETKESKRSSKLKRKMTERVKLQRKRLRTRKKLKLDKEKDVEKGDSYIPGGF